MEYLTIFAIIIGPIAAVQVQKYLERTREQVDRKREIFRILMATRGLPTSYSHFEALNKIVIDFQNPPKYKKVVKAWIGYLDYLCNTPREENRKTEWEEKRLTSFATLMLVMGDSLGYELDEEMIKRKAYVPQSFIDELDEKDELRKFELRKHRPFTLGGPVN